MAIKRKYSEKQALRKYTPMLHKIAWSFHYTTGLDVDDLFSEACVGFLRAFRSYDSSKGELGTRIWVVVNNHLKTYLKKQGTRPLPVYEFDEEMEDPRRTLEAREDFAYMVSKLSREAQDLVQVVLSSPEEFMMETARATRGSLTKFLRRKGWPVEKIAGCFREIKSVLNG